MNALTHAELSDAELDELEDFLYSDAVSEDSLDLVGVHGLFTACNISPKAVSEQEWSELVFDGAPILGFPGTARPYHGNAASPVQDDQQQPVQRSGD